MKSKEKPYAWIYTVNNTYTWVSFVEPPDDAFDEGTLVHVYTKPQNKEWQSITDEEIRQTDHHMVDGAYHYSFKQGAKWADSVLKERNNDTR